MEERAIGVDIGATRTKMVLLEAPGTVLKAEELASGFASPEAAITTLAGRAAGWLRVSDGPPPTAIGVAVPGLVERAGGRVLRAPNLRVLEGFEVGVALAEATGLTVTVDNDAHAAGLAEARLGAAAGCETAVCLTIGTGVGGAIIHEGRIWRGRGGLAGELGRVVLDPEGRTFFEEGVGAAAVVEAFRSLSSDPGSIASAAEVGRLADAGDGAAQEALARCGRLLGVGLAILVNLLNPERIVIGGGVAGAGDWFLGPAREEAERRAWNEAWNQCQVVPARLGARAGAIGAAIMCWCG